MSWASCSSEDPRPQLARVLPEERHVAQVTVRGPSSLILRQPVGLTLARFLLQVELQLLAELVFFTPPLQPQGQLPPRRRHGPSSTTGFSSSPMARANASHFDCSLASCFRPNGVMR